MSNQKKNNLDHSTWTLIRRLVREGVSPYAGRIWLSMVFMAVASAATGASAYLMKPIVNEVFVEKHAEMLWPIAGAVIATFLIKGVATYAQSGLVAWVGLRIIADMQNRLFAHLIRMDLAYFHSGSTGGLVSRFTVDINMMRGAVSNGLVALGRDILSTLILVGVMFFNDWQLAAVSFFAFPAAIRPIAKLGKRIRRVTANTQEQMGEFNTLLEQSFQGVRMVKAYGMENYERNKIEVIADEIFNLVYKANRVRAASSPIMETLGGAAVAVVIVYGGHRVVAGLTDPGAFFSFMTALIMAYEPVKRLANLNTDLQQGMAAAQRLFEVLDSYPAIVETPNARPLQVSGGSIRFDAVDFSYGPDKTALNSLNLEVPAGRKVALVGPSGGGKSTILNMIPRFYDTTGGRVSIDGQDVRDVTLESLRSHIALVSQEVSLFDDTVRANIGYGRFDASEDDIVAAAHGAAAHEFVMALPQGYDTVVGEHGVKLSGGQRQRLSIARAMLRNAPILLLDEATSALDTESERQVQAALETLMQGRTTLVVAHRLSTIADADLIHVVDKGRVVESGSHAELLARGGMYARLWNLQFAEETQPFSAGA